jgi:tryptophanyl-tRNA synthetase
MNERIVTPWDSNVKSEEDYKRLIEIFGVEEITSELLDKIEKFTGDLHPLLKRKFYYAHREFDKALLEYERGEKFFLYTGRAPSGEMHIGHLIPFIFTKWLQEKFEVNVYIELPDEEKFWAKKTNNYEETRERAYKEAKIIASLGFDPDRTFIFVDSEYIKHLYTAAIYIARDINLSTAKAVFGFSGETTIGLVFYPSLQIAPTFFEEGRCVIPCGIDQDPYFRLQRDLAEKYGYKKCSTILSKFIWGLKGPYTKMSSSDPTSAIYLTDDYEMIRSKIFRYAFSGGRPSLEEHRKYGGNPDIDVCFFWLRVLFEEDDKKLKELEEKYRSGELLTGELKEYTAKKIWEFLEELNKRVEKVNIEKFMYDGKLAQRMWEWEFKPKKVN